MSHPNGAYSPSLDKLDQGVDMIKEATSSAGFRFNADVAVLVETGSNMIYDEVS